MFDSSSRLSHTTTGPTHGAVGARCFDRDPPPTPLLVFGDCVTWANLQVLHQQPPSTLSRPIDTVASEADPRAFRLPPVSFNSISLAGPGAQTNLGEAGNNGGGGGGAAGGGWKAKDNYGSAFVFTSGSDRTLGRIDCQRRLPRGT